jgi:hypothetical protein
MDAQIINYNHMMPTRYAIELDGLKGLISYETFKEPSQREETKKVVKKLFEEKYQGGKNKWFFTALRVSPLPPPHLSSCVMLMNRMLALPALALLYSVFLYLLVLICSQSHLDDYYDQPTQLREPAPI